MIRDARSGGEEYLGSEEIELRPPVAVPFDSLDAGDVPLDGAGVMLERQAFDDGRREAPYAGGEAPQFGQVVGFHSVQPGGQFPAAPLGYDLGERPDVLLQALEVGAIRLRSRLEDSGVWSEEDVYDFDVALRTRNKGGAWGSR
jgi:hypothetical protein